jgi:ribosomal protein L11 methyltransferase
MGVVLMDAGAVGCQEDYLPGEKPPTRQPWDTGPLAPEPERLVLKAWWAAGDRSKAEAQVDALLAEAEDVERVSWVQVVDESWEESWRAAAVRIEVCEGLVVAPPWLAQPGDLIIEPGMAFGTGDHATTLSCLRAVMRQRVVGERCLDVGTGSGILAIAAARIGMVAWGIDIDPESARAATDNARLNGTEIQADLTPLAAVDGRFELVVANLFAEVIVALSTDLKRVASRHLAVAGVLADRADLVVEALAPMRLVRRDIEGDWCHMGFEW